MYAYVETHQEDWSSTVFKLDLKLCITVVETGKKRAEKQKKPEINDKEHKRCIADNRELGIERNEELVKRFSSCSIE